MQGVFQVGLRLHLSYESVVSRCFKLVFRMLRNLTYAQTVLSILDPKIQNIQVGLLVWSPCATPRSRLSQDLTSHYCVPWIETESSNETPEADRHRSTVASLQSGWGWKGHYGTLPRHVFALSLSFPSWPSWPFLTPEISSRQPIWRRTATAAWGPWRRQLRLPHVLSRTE